MPVPTDRPKTFPCCEIRETPLGPSAFALVISYNDTFQTSEPMGSLKDARLRAEEWQRIWDLYRKRPFIGSTLRTGSD